MLNGIFMVYMIYIGSIGGCGRISEAPSPQLALWMDDSGPIDVVAVDTDGVPNTMGGGLLLDPSVPEGWKDKDFPHDNSSIGTLAPGLALEDM